MMEEKAPPASSPSRSSLPHGQIGIGRLFLTGNTFPCCYQGLLIIQDKYFFTIEVSVQKRFNPLSRSFCIGLIKAHHVIQLALFRFPEETLAETGRQLSGLVISKKVTMKCDGPLNVKS